MDVWQSLLAFLVAAAIAWLELITSKYSRTCFLLVPRCWALWVYSGVYGLISLGTVVGFDSLTSSGTLTVEGLGADSLWMRAVVIGLSAKALLHIRLFTVSSGAKSFPVGTETIVQIFEPWLLRTIELYEFERVRIFVTERAEEFSDLVAVRSAAKKNIPNSFWPDEKTAFEADLDRQESAVEVMELYLRFLGKYSFNRVFSMPLSKPQGALPNVATPDTEGG